MAESQDQTDKDIAALSGLEDASPAELALFNDWDDVEELGGFDSEVWDEQSPLIGFFSGKKIDVGPHNSMMYQFDTPAGQFAVWGSTVLDNLMEEVEDGDLVRIEATGTHQGAEYTYKTYSVKVKRPTRASIAQ